MQWRRRALQSVPLCPRRHLPGAASLPADRQTAPSRARACNLRRGVGCRAGRRAARGQGPRTITLLAGVRMNQRRWLRLTLAALLAALTFAQPHRSEPQATAQTRPAFTASERLARVVRDVVNAAVEHFGKGGLTADKIAVTLIDLNDRSHPQWASHRGQEPTYPASVVKLFYLVAAHQQMETGALKATPELER